MQTPPGFIGLQSNQPLRIYEQLLPHWRQKGATYFVTFRLGDSIPQEKIQYLEKLKREWKRKNPAPQSAVAEEFHKKLQRMIEKWLDQGCGSCLLKQAENIGMMNAEIQRGQQVQYELGCYVIMPNHVHAVVKPIHEDFDLEDVLKRWKGASALKIHQHSKGSGSVWQPESYDRIIRDLEHLARIVQYIGRNPSLAGIPPMAQILWLNPVWRELGWKFEHEF